MQKNIRVLIVDDDEVDRTRIARMLQDQCALSEAATANQAWEMVREIRPACVLLDYRLPDATGLEVLQRLVAEQIPVVLLTGAGNERVAVEAMKSGAEDYLVKSDFDEHTIRMAVNNAIEKSALRQLADDRLNEYEELVAVASQRLRDPVFQLGQFAVAIAEQIAHGNMDEAADASGRLQENATELVSFIACLHQYGKSASDLQVERVDLNSVVAEVRDDLDRRYDQEIDYSIGALPAIDGDLSMMRVLMRNLLESAILHADESRKLRIKMSSQLDVGEWTIYVSDDSAGLEIADQSSPFNPLQTRSADNGYGLALPTCAKIARRHNGRIWIEKNGPDGTTIACKLPAIADQRRL
ncbi:MAG: response regulator [Pirellulaceae bacterium]|nr:response regulator [Pirellulaceae bacterium]